MGQLVGVRDVEQHDHHRHVYRDEKEQILNRLKRIEGQIRGIYGMVEDDRYCVDILNQISAVRAALGRLGLLLLEDHTRGCVVDAIKEGNDAEAVKELTEVIKHFVEMR